MEIGGKILAITPRMIAKAAWDLDLIEKKGGRVDEGLEEVSKTV
jgi:hypothetical protein